MKELLPRERFIRTLRREDLPAVAEIDRKISGRSRREYLSRRVETALRDSSVCISLAAEADGTVAGFLMGSLYYGEFGIPEPVAILDTIGVDLDRRHRKVALRSCGSWCSTCKVWESRRCRPRSIGRNAISWPSSLPWASRRRRASDSSSTSRGNRDVGWGKNRFTL